VLAAALVAVLIFSGVAFAGNEPEQGKAKYVFLFIGDGMGVAQRRAAELFLGKIKGVGRSEEARLVMNTFPAQGLNTTSDLTSVIPDSASAATAISSGHKTASGVIGMDPGDKISYENIAETAKKKQMKVGIITTVSLDHATSAAFYAHVPSREQMYDISMQLANSRMDFFAGGQLQKPEDKKNPGKPKALDVARKNGFTVVTGRAAFEALEPGGGRVIAMNAPVDQDQAMNFTIDQRYGRGQVTLAEYLAKGIKLLDNPQGFFIMAEGGKIDWACHANDAGAAIHDTLALDEAVAEAVKFYRQRPRETLIVVTGDHETGGMSIGFAGAQYAFFMDNIRQQKMSYLQFNKELNAYKNTPPRDSARFEDLLPLIKVAFGLYKMAAEEKNALEQKVDAGKAPGASPEAKKAGEDAEKKLKDSLALSDLELKALKDAFKQTMLSPKERAQDDRAYLLYGGYEPLTVRLTTILNNKAGIGWTTYAHTGAPVQTSALGVGAELFNGYYDQTDIYRKIVQITGLTR